MRGFRILFPLVLLPLLARAHDPGISTAQGDPRAGLLVLTTGFAPADVETLLPASVPRSPTWGQAEFEAEIGRAHV